MTLAGLDISTKKGMWVAKARRCDTAIVTGIAWAHTPILGRRSSRLVVRFATNWELQFFLVILACLDVSSKKWCL